MIRELLKRKMGTKIENLKFRDQNLKENFRGTKKRNFLYLEWLKTYLTLKNN
jgi:hypothetical protein